MILRSFYSVSVLLRHSTLQFPVLMLLQRAWSETAKNCCHYETPSWNSIMACFLRKRYRYNKTKNGDDQAIDRGDKGQSTVRKYRRRSRDDGILCFLTLPSLYNTGPPIDVMSINAFLPLERMRWNQITLVRLHVPASIVSVMELSVIECLKHLTVVNGRMLVKGIEHITSWSKAGFMMIALSDSQQGNPTSLCHQQTTKQLTIRHSSAEKRESPKVRLASAGECIEGSLPAWLDRVLSWCGWPIRSGVEWRDFAKFAPLGAFPLNAHSGCLAAGMMVSCD